MCTQAGVLFVRLCVRAHARVIMRVRVVRVRVHECAGVPVPSLGALGT